MHNLRVETFIKIIFLVSLVSIISAYFIEYVLGHQPCNLCLIERIPYGLAVVLIILNHILIKNKRFMILLLILVFSFSLIISFYHFGIEQGIFEESAVCELIDTSNIVSKEELLKQLQVKNVSCKDVTFRIFGFSLTSLNIIISLILVIFLSKVFKNYEKFKK
ncbi:disulfide bond formation protein B [Candidatus Pelagibacter sp.]|jgi:disulfide bond formation protein DsbB|nr:disulfide bond formation protein B [Candidatus Pelagibacter sp.]|tara:strand:- start:265 stop:753 length:489 start_codon:yes stop_codon:yes gene_type:complete